tara:strand:+ start:5121 stop:5438 length:318 start_codon:yes stop_codon:yes gene_type:complete
MVALGVYLSAAALIVICLTWWLWRRAGALLTLVVVALAAALLFTPAFPRPGVDTMAPATIVAAFQYFTGGYEAAVHALRPLLVICGAALALAILVGILALRRRRL